jgi:hypothetical protein
MEEMELEWIVVYEDGSELWQYQEDGTESKYSDIDRKRLAEFHLRIKGEEKTVLAQAIEPGQRLIYRKRHSMSGVTGEKNWTIHLLGWQQTVNGQNIQSISWVFPDGSIINTGKFRENHPVLYGVELLPEEVES